MRQRLDQRRRRGFSLVEMLIVVAIMAILASVAVRYVDGAADDAKATTVAQNLRSVANAANYHYSYKQRWPRSVYGHNAPGDFEGLLNRETFTREPSIAAADISRYGWFAIGDNYAAAYVAYVDVDNAMQVDELLDDGDAGAGFIRVYRWNSPMGPIGTIAYWLRYPL